MNNVARNYTLHGRRFVNQVNGRLRQRSACVPDGQLIRGFAAHRNRKHSSPRSERFSGNPYSSV
jgi:hypothetical protein